TMQQMSKAKKALKLQWSHGIATVETSLSTIGTRRVQPASMEPRHRYRGNATVALRTSEDSWRFNGATASLPWKHRRLRGVPEESRAASMEPRHRYRGNTRLG